MNDSGASEPVVEAEIPVVTTRMNSEEFRKQGKRMVDFVADYWDTIRERKPLHDVKPGYIWDLVSSKAPENGESWEAIFGDLESVVMTPNTHWHHPHFFAYYPTAVSYPALVADILSGGLACIGFTWNSSPSCTELEMVVMDWLAKLLQLPDHFLNSDPGPGGGIIQCTASDCTLVAMLAARSRVCRNAREPDVWAKISTAVSTVGAYVPKAVKGLATRLPSWGSTASVDKGQVQNPAAAPASPRMDSELFPKLVAYCSDQAHSSVDRAALFAAMRIRKLPTKKEDGYALTGTTLEAAIQEDVANGLIPFFVCATVGATTCCASDRVGELARVSQKYGAWIHVDAAYAGSAAVCPEYRYLLDGIELVDSFNFNAHKWLMMTFDCSCMWFSDTTHVETAFNVDPLYLKHDHQNTVPDFRHWQIPLGRRFRSLKVWFVLRALGAEALRDHVRSMCRLAEQFGRLVESDDQFELFCPVTLGLVCFRLKGANEPSELLHKEINKDRRIHLVPANVHGIYFLRLAVCSTETNEKDIDYAWNVIKELTNKLQMGLAEAVER